MPKEIGGYIEFEHYHGKQFHEGAIKLNCSRNCLAYMIKLHNIKHIYIPYFLCDSVMNICIKYEVKVSFFYIDKNFLPIIPDVDFSKAWLYLVNYYGQLTNETIVKLSESIQNLIVDNVQSFFQQPVKHVSTIYNCRKFFGVADGAYLYSDKTLNSELERDYSYNRMDFLLGRFERNASVFYSKYVANNELFSNEPIKKMSILTENIMCSLDYERIKTIRTDNFTFLHEHFKNLNKLNLIIPSGAFAYPLYIENGTEIRKKLQLDKIYIPTLWPDVFNLCKENELENQFAQNILPIPVDQRYELDDMAYMTERIKIYLS